MKVLRIVLVLAAVAVAGLGIAVALTSSYTDRSDDIDHAITISELNEDSAESAPQQQVVNGWLAADLLEIQTQQLNDIQKSQSTTNLMLGLIGAIVAIGILALVLRPTERAPAPASPAVQPDQSIPETSTAADLPNPEPSPAAPRNFDPPPPP